VLRTFSRNLKQRLTSRYERSVFRRAFLLLALVVPAFAANFLVLYVCALWLGAVDFGIFYAANAIGNILFSGSLILNLAFTRYLAEVQINKGSQGLLAGTLKIQRAVILWGGLITVVLIGSGLAAGSSIGVRSAIVIVLIALDAFTAYVGDVGRVLLQVSRKTVALGLYTLIWMVLRLLLCMAGLLLFGTVWGALSGVVLSSLLMIGGFNLMLLGRHLPKAGSVGRLPSLASELPGIAGYGLLATITNLDVLVSYFTLPSATFGVYSASSILPKAILAVVMPLQQMLFPHMVGGSDEHADHREFRWKVAIAVVGISAVGAVFTFIVQPLACGAPPGILLCRPDLMEIMLLSVVPLAFVRALLLDDIVDHRHLPAFCLLIPLIGYAAWAIRFAVGSEVAMAWGYVGCCFAAAAVLLGVRWGFARVRTR
jgi:O-antigen/teichoic acid export membrane protein